MFAFLRRARAGDVAVVVCNFTPVVRYGYRVGVPAAGRYRELFNSDALEYGGSGTGNLGAVGAGGMGAHGHAHSLALTLPPLGALVLAPARDDNGPGGP